MSRRSLDPHVKSIIARLGNAHRERNKASGSKMTRSEFFTLYAIERILYRVGRSPYATQFALKGGMLAGALLDSPFRATRDADLLGPGKQPSVRRMREAFESIAAMDTYGQDGIEVRQVRAMRAQVDEDGYDGVKLMLEVSIGRTAVVVQVDVGFGDGVSPRPQRLLLPSVISGDSVPSAEVYAYPLEVFVAEKVETLVAKFPAISHRLKDLVDIYVSITRRTFEAEVILSSFRRTFSARETAPNLDSLHALQALGSDRLMRRDWAKMLKDKRVSVSMPDIRDVVELIIQFTEPLITAMATHELLEGRWEPESRAWTFPGGEDQSQ